MTDEQLHKKSTTVSSSKAIDPDLEEVVVKYCVRIFEQADALWNPGNADYRFHQTSVVQALKFAQTIPNGDVDYMAVESAAVEAVYVLETLCRIDTTLVSFHFQMYFRFDILSRSLALCR